MPTKNTKIVCTLGPSSDSVEEIQSLISAGMNVARLNFSHGTHKHHKLLINNIRKAAKLSKKTIGILQDLQGPKIRVLTKNKESFQVKKREQINIGIEKTPKKYNFAFSHKEVLIDAKKGHKILINDGLIEGEIKSKSKDHITVQVKTSGEIKNGNGLSFPNSKLTVPEITKKDLEDLKFGLKNDIDFIALSFVKSSKSIEDLRKLISKKRKTTPIVAKIERHEAVENLESIIESADCIMVARGDLGTDIPAEMVPIIQKRIISISNRLGKPVITATQVLQSMIENPRPTRAEVSDAANAVFDHTDAIMLSNETAVGKYPAKATKMLSKVSNAVEDQLRKYEELLEHTPNKHLTKLNAAVLNACELAIDSNAKAIVIYTDDGFTAQQVSKHRLYVPIITITPSEEVQKRLTLAWGINKVYIKKFSKNIHRKHKQIIKYLKTSHVVKINDKVVVLTNASKKESTISLSQIT